MLLTRTLLFILSMLAQCHFKSTHSFSHVRHVESAGEASLLIRTHSNLFTLSAKDQPSTRPWECHRRVLDFGQIRLEAIKQSSKQQGQQPKCQEGTVMRGSTVMPTSALAPGGRVESLATFTLHSGSRRWPMSPYPTCCTLSADV